MSMVGLCEASFVCVCVMGGRGIHCRDATGIETDFESVLFTAYAEELLAKLKLCNMWQ